MSRERARQNYRMWSKKDVDKEVKVRVDWQPDMELVGKAEQIVYSSDKWEEKPFEYVHDFDSHPSVHMEPGRLDLDVEPKLVATSTLLRASIYADQEVAVLGHVKEFSFDPCDGGRRILYQFKDMPVLVCTNDRKTIIIMSTKLGPIMVRGGTMYVSERGIVH